MGGGIFLVAVGLLFAATFYAQHRAGFRWWRPKPPVPDHDFAPGHYRTLLCSSQIGWMAARGAGGLKLDESWARVSAVRRRWIDREQTVAVERVRILGMRAVMFRSADGRYDDVIVFGVGSMPLFRAFGWPVRD